MKIHRVAAVAHVHAPLSLTQLSATAEFGIQMASIMPDFIF